MLIEITLGIDLAAGISPTRLSSCLRTYAIKLTLHPPSRPIAVGRLDESRE